jgi:hypothetical protein
VEQMPYDRDLPQTVISPLRINRPRDAPRARKG